MIQAIQIIFIKTLSEKATEKLRDKKQIKNIWEFTNLRKSDYRDFSLIGILFFFSSLIKSQDLKLAKNLELTPKSLFFGSATKEPEKTN